MNQKSYTQSKWSLADLFPDSQSPEMDAAFKQLEIETAAFEKFRPQLDEEIESERFLQITSALESIHNHMQKLGGYAELWFAADTQSQPAQTLVAKMEQLSADVSNRVMFFSLWWKDLRDDAAQRLMENSGDLRYWLEEMRHFKPHTLSEPEEKIINIKNVTGANALVLLYDALTNRYTFKVKLAGEEKEMTRGELMSLVRQADPDVRAAAYQEQYRVYGNDGALLGQMYQTRARDWRNEQLTLRGYSSPISARNLVNDIPDSVVDTLLDVARKNAPLFQRFFKLKARWLGMPKLRRYDIYAPVAKSDKKYSFEQACGMVLDSFRGFDPRLAELAEKVMSENHLDSEVRRGKRSGAFCATINPHFTPWVLVNYQGRSEDVATLAHELGHAIHSLLANHHSAFTQHACLPLAETASTFGEMMLVDKLLASESDEGVRRDMLFRQVDDSYATIMRQSFFALFEKTAHQMTADGASVDELSAAYMENLKQMFGDSLEIGEEFKWEWVSIPHIYHVPFYVYAYAFGQLLVLALYQQYKREGDAFKPRYLRLLSAGGSVAPMQLLREAGIDAADASFWQGGFDVIADLVDELEKMPV